MADYDVFNGDADGICSLIQLRLAEPRNAELITGVKRDIALLKNVPLNAGKVTVLDISMEKNKTALQELISHGAHILYADHHKSGEIPENENLQAHIDLSPSVCTALIVDKLLKGEYKAWALTAAFGDNLKKEAYSLAVEAGFSQDQVKQMEDLGTYINYNGYGGSIDDLYFHPADLYREMAGYKTPFEFIDEKPKIFHTLKKGYEEDMAKVQETPCFRGNDNVALYILPNKKWARRVSGVYSNDLANQEPNRAHAVLTEKEMGDYLVSIRAPKNNPYGASAVASKFPSGGGREAAAGINTLEDGQVDILFERLSSKYS